LILLNEVKTKNLDKLTNKSFRDLAEDFPVELVRIFYKGIKETGVTVDKEKEKDSIKYIAANEFFDEHKECKLKFTGDINLSIELRRGELKVKINTWSSDYYLPEVTLRFSNKESVNNIVNKIKEYFNENKVSGTYDKSEREKVKNKYSTISNFPNEIKSLKKFANKNLYNLYIGYTDEVLKDIYSIVLIFDVNDILPPKLASQIETNKIIDIERLRYSFQIELLQKIVDFAITKIESINHNIIRVIPMGSRLKILISKNTGSKKFDGEKIESLHKQNKEKLKNLGDVYKYIKKLELHEFKQEIIKIALGENNEI